MRQPLIAEFQTKNTIIGKNQVNFNKLKANKIRPVIAYFMKKTLHEFELVNRDKKSQMHVQELRIRKADNLKLTSGSEPSSPSSDFEHLWPER